jgi:hypothetical protein
VESSPRCSSDMGGWWGRRRGLTVRGLHAMGADTAVAGEGTGLTRGL